MKMENDGKSEVSSEYNAVMFQESRQVNPGFSTEKHVVPYQPDSIYISLYPAFF